MSANDASRRPPHITVNNSAGIAMSAMRSDSSHSTGTPPSTSRSLLPAQRAISGQSSRQSSHGSSVYGTPRAQAHESSDMLLPPSSGRVRQHKPYLDSPSHSASPSAVSSRRSSWSSDGGRNRDSRQGPFMSPFDDSRAPSRADSSDEEQVNTQTVADKYTITPSAGLLLYPEDVEKDDWLHNPDPKDSDRDCNIFTKRGMINIGGLLFVTLGVLVLFVGLPIISSLRDVTHKKGYTCKSDPMCLSESLPLLKNQRIGLIDPATPKSALTKKSHSGKTLNLVFSDEFNTDGRTFYPGDDPYWEAVDIWYGATQDLEWYDPDAVSTSGGTLNIRFDAFQSHNLNYRSGMVQSWNKLCFKGGRLEASISLPGRGDISGFWPGFWAMGNLGRPGYTATTEGMWPYSYHDTCDVGITANQSQPDGISYLPGMKMPACTCANEDHPSPGISRSAPEIDAIEASVGFLQPPLGSAVGSASQSFQAAPFDIFYQPDYNFVEVYDRSVTSMNGYTGGPFQEAMSAVTWLNNDWYDGKAYQTYGFEYTPGGSGDIAWFVGDDYTWKLDHRAMRPNGNVGQRVVPQEPMSMIMNFGISTTFAQVFFPNLAELMPATMRFDYVRIYQEEGTESITCDPDGYPTTSYIKSHPEPYSNVNLTSWDKTKYSWPKNTFVNDCKS